MKIKLCENVIIINKNECSYILNYNNKKMYKFKGKLKNYLMSEELDNDYITKLIGWGVVEIDE